MDGSFIPKERRKKELKRKPEEPVDGKGFTVYSCVYFV
jgi:hypothetical protein